MSNGGFSRLYQGRRHPTCCRIQRRISAHCMEMREVNPAVDDHERDISAVHSALPEVVDVEQLHDIGRGSDRGRRSACREAGNLWIGKKPGCSPGQHGVSRGCREIVFVDPATDDVCPVTNLTDPGRCCEEAQANCLHHRRSSDRDRWKGCIDGNSWRQVGNRRRRIRHRHRRLNDIGGIGHGQKNAQYCHDFPRDCRLQRKQRRGNQPRPVAGTCIPPTIGYNRTECAIGNQLACILLRDQG